MTRQFFPWRTTLVAGSVIAAANLVILAIGHLAGVDLQVAQAAGSPATEVGPGSVVVMSVVPAALGGLLLRLATSRGVRTWRTVGWLGLALGLLTVPMPFLVRASTATSLTLACMHVAAGVIWLVLVVRAVPHSAGAREAGEEVARRA